MFSPSVVPTGRGFDSFFGYYGGAEDYLTHTSGKFLDLHDDQVNVTLYCMKRIIPKHPITRFKKSKGAHLSPAQGYDGQYSAQLYATKAVDVIQRHASREDDSPLFLYLAFQASFHALAVAGTFLDMLLRMLPCRASTPRMRPQRAMLTGSATPSPTHSQLC